MHPTLDKKLHSIWNLILRLLPDPPMSHLTWEKLFLEAVKQKNTTQMKHLLTHPEKSSFISPAGLFKGLHIATKNNFSEGIECITHRHEIHPQQFFHHFRKNYETSFYNDKDNILSFGQWSNTFKCIYHQDNPQHRMHLFDYFAQAQHISFYDPTLGLFYTIKEAFEAQDFHFISQALEHPRMKSAFMNHHPVIEDLIHERFSDFKIPGWSDFIRSMDEHQILQQNQEAALQHLDKLSNESSSKRKPLKL